MLEALSNAGVAMCVATATRRDCALAALEGSTFSNISQRCSPALKWARAKPNPTFFELALSHLGTHAKPRLCSKIRCTLSKRRMRPPSP